MPNHQGTAPGEAEPASRPNSPAPRRFRVHPVKIVALGLIVLGLVILGYPFYGIVRYELFRPAPAYPYRSQLSAKQLEPTLPSEQLPKIGARLPTESRLVIPKIGVDMPIVEGADERALFRGSWRIPNTSTPDQGGNTVLTVHRFQYLAGPNTLALADRLEPGDTIIVYWKQGDRVVEYDYRVNKTFLVTPNQTEILNNSVEPKLTIFTCAPMFSTKQRLVIDARPIPPAEQE